ncbi:hypothetical protein JCM3770_004598 [Rhodotorula araucariae]
MLSWRPLALAALARVATRPALLPFSSPRLFSATSAALLVRKPTKIKLKTHQGAAKRWKALANGEFKRAKAGRVHLNSNGSMSRERLNRLGEPAFARPAWKRTLRRLLPYA